MSRQEENVIGSAFEETLLQALKLLAQPARLGAESPLAAPYFLSRALPPGSYLHTPESRGHLLKSVIKTVAQQLWQGPLPKNRAEMQAAIKEVRKERGTPPYSYLVLELRYFQEYLQPRSLREIYEDDAYLLDSKTGDHRSHKVALQQLGELLLAQLRPALRLEQPVAPALFVGYAQEEQKLNQALQHRQTVSLSGAGGVGKTTLAARILQQRKGQPHFWYTFHPTLNDRLSSLLFGLGYFLHEQSTSQLWQYLIAQQGALTDFTVALGLAHQDLAARQAEAPLLCFDELDRITHSDPGQIQPAHRQLLEFIESLRGLAPILLIGQRPIIDSDHYLTLTGLKPVQIPALWQGGGCTIHAIDVEKLFRATGGNLRLLRIALALQQDGVAIDEVVAQLAGNASIYPLFHRLWSRLDDAERQTLQQLAVFRGPAPEQLGAPQTIASLVARHLVEQDGQGGIMMVANLPELIYPELGPEVRETLHHQAAQLLLSYAEYTEAAYHLWKAARPDLAIQLWYPQRQSEIRRGHTDAALVIFEGISRNQLRPQEQQGLDLLRAELRYKRGDLTKGLADIGKAPGRAASEANARLMALQGDYQEALGYPDQAIRSYHEGIQILTRLQAEASRFHYRLGKLQLRQKELAAAKREARLLECQLQNLYGVLEVEEGRYGDALISYQKALALAQAVGDEAQLADSYRNLAKLFGARLQKLDQAVDYFQKAIACYEQLGDRMSVEQTRDNLTATYLQTRQFHAALETAAPTYRFFKAIQATYPAANAGVNLAEAHLELGNLEEAERYALEVLDLEERQAYPYACFNLGRVAFIRGNHAKARGYLEQSVRSADMNEDRYMQAYALRELGKVLLTSEEAIGSEQLRAAQQLFQQLGMTQEVQETEKLLA
jgi:tetratricopeptide (TPR) repeat protein